MNNISELKFDDKNFNKHTEYGMSLLEKSLRENGAGRSILIDKDNNIIAGNGIIEAAGSIGLENIKIIETTGDEIVAVKRTDISLDSEKGRQMALDDNATSAIDLEWNKELIQEESKKWGLDINRYEELFGSIGWEIDDVIENASEGSIKDFDDDVNYDLNNLIRRDVDKNILDKIEDYEKNNLIRKEIAEILKRRASQCCIFNFDEIIKYYRSEDSTPEEKELLEKLYLVFITPKDAIEKGILNINTITGEIYDKGLFEGEDEED